MTHISGVALGPYQLIERIGRGGMGTVYKAYHPALDRMVAIKVLPEAFSDDSEFSERFLQEARSVARLKHPNILQVFDFDQSDGRSYLVMELVEGGRLSDRLGRPMDLREVIRLLMPIAGALDYAHAHGIVHRDIKPSNILLHVDGTPVLADFGLAKLASATRSITATGTVVGTPEYMSPEQSAGEPIGPPSDRYSLAIVGYEMLTGRVPFQADTPAAVLLSHLNKAVPPAVELRGELSGHIDAALQRALAKVPEERYNSAAAFITALTPAAWPSALPEDRPAKAPTATPGRHMVPQVLVVDDGAANRELIEACLAGIDCEVRPAEDGETALREIEMRKPDLVLLDVQMPGMNGYEVCRRIKGDAKTRLIPVVMITSLDRTSDRVEALNAGADDYMSKPVERVELVARVRSALRLKSVYDSLDSAEQVIFSLAAAVEAKDPYTEAHAQRVADAARRVGVSVGVPEDMLDALYRGGLIHDIGKIGVPDAILLKRGPLDDKEMSQMRAHTSIGAEIVAPLPSAEHLLPIIRHHHERFDGGGYPDGLRGQQIPWLARIVAVCDAYDALVNDRPYRPRRSREEAIAVLMNGAGTQWDAEVVDSFLREVASVPQRKAAGVQ
jgi:putative two-component system response regulator